jgi:hypothetical protein
MPDVDSDFEHCFYHSFPRRNATDAHGLRVLELMCRNGLLLVPEEVSWCDPTQPDRTKRIHAVQRRLCFTGLSRDELARHLQTFGPFSIELSAEALRSIGGLPVIYVPEQMTDDHLYDGIGTSLLGNLAASATVISQLAETMQLDGESIWLDVKFNDGRQIKRTFSAIETSAIKEFLTLVSAAQGLPFHEMRNAMMAMSSLFYPTDNPRYNGILGYYRQREWRVISGLFVRGKPTTSVATVEQSSELLQLDTPFFSQELAFADGLFSLAKKSHFLSRIHDKHVLSLVNRVIVPASCRTQAGDILKRYGIEVPVSTMH